MTQAGQMCERVIFTLIDHVHIFRLRSNHMHAVHFAQPARWTSPAPHDRFPLDWGDSKVRHNLLERFIFRLRVKLLTRSVGQILH